MNPSQVSARSTEEGARFNNVLFATLDALEEAKIPFAIIGGVAVGGLGRPRSTHDIDIFVRPEDAEATIRVLAKHGFRTDKFDIEWLFKAFLDDILVDIIFRSKGDIYFDEEMQAHRRHVEYHGRRIPVVSPEDLVIIKCAVHYEGGPHHWHDALAILSHASIDWNYLLRRARRAPRRLLALLIYAQSSDILIPNYVIAHLYEYVFGGEPKQSAVRESPLRAPAHSSGRAPDYIVAHICEALKEDGRTAQQDLHVLLSGRQITIEGTAPSEASRHAVEEVVGRAAPNYELANRVQVASFSGPEPAEEIS
jgi:predicted nucleotidyltransferase